MTTVSSEHRVCNECRPTPEEMEAWRDRQAAIYDSIYFDYPDLPPVRPRRRRRTKRTGRPTRRRGVGGSGERNACRRSRIEGVTQR